MSTVHLFKQKSTAVCNKATQLAVNWDLATYSGYQVNVGIVYSPDLETATVLLPKAWTLEPDLSLKTPVEGHQKPLKTTS